MFRVIALLTALVATGGALSQFILTVFVSDKGVAAGLLRYISFFTNWNAIAGAVVAWAVVLAPQSRFARPIVLLAMSALMIVVIVLYELLLRGRDGPQILAQMITTDVQHDLLPVLFVTMWALSPHPGLRWRAATAAMVMPLTYLVFGLTRGLIDDFWAYWFLNMPKLGLVTFVRNSAGVLFMFLLVGLVLVAIDRWLAHRRARRAGLRSAP